MCCDTQYLYYRRYFAKSSSELNMAGRASISRAAGRPRPSSKNRDKVRILYIFIVAGDVVAAVMLYAVDTRTRTNEMSTEFAYFYILSTSVCVHTQYTIIYIQKCPLLHVRTFVYDVFSPPPATHPLAVNRRRDRVRYLSYSRDVGRRRVERARARALDDKSSLRTERSEKPQL